MKWAFSIFFVGISFVRRQTSAVFERPTLRGCQCGGALGRVKSLRTLTLPCQRTNPDGVICGGIGWGWDVRVNVNTIGVINSASVDHLMS